MEGEGLGSAAGGLEWSHGKNRRKGGHVMIKTWILVLMMTHDNGGTATAISPFAYESEASCQKAATALTNGPTLFANAQQIGICLPGPNKWVKQ